MLAKKAKEVLTLLNKTGLLNEIILIGSWCGHFYQLYFGKNNFSPNIQTLDIDLLIPTPNKIRGPKIDGLLQELDFEEEFTNSGWIKFVHPELRIEFLVPRLSAQPDKPKFISNLNISAMPLRHMSVLTKHVISIQDGKMVVRVPHPAVYSLHKLFVSCRRHDKAKAYRDQEMAFRLIGTMKETGAISDFAKIIPSFTKNEIKAIKEIIEKLHPEYLKIF